MTPPVTAGRIERRLELRPRAAAAVVFVVAVKPAIVNIDVIAEFSRPPESPTSLLMCWLAPVPPLNVIA